MVLVLLDGPARPYVCFLRFRTILLCTKRLFSLIIFFFGTIKFTHSFQLVVACRVVIASLESTTPDRRAQPVSHRAVSAVWLFVIIEGRKEPSREVGVECVDLMRMGG